jgi:hypothetical protein
MVLTGRLRITAQEGLQTDKTVFYIGRRLTSSTEHFRSQMNWGIWSIKMGVPYRHLVTMFNFRKLHKYLIEEKTCCASLIASIHTVTLTLNIHDCICSLWPYLNHSKARYSFPSFLIKTTAGVPKHTLDMWDKGTMNNATSCEALSAVATAAFA